MRATYNVIKIDRVTSMCKDHGVAFRDVKLQAQLRGLRN